MQVAPLRRLAIAAACSLIAIAALAGTSAGSSVAPLRATAPRLIAHDTSGRPAARHIPKRQVTTKALAGPRVFNDSTTDANVSNTSSDIGLTQFVVGSHTYFDVFSRAGGTFPLLAVFSHASFWAGLTVPDAAGLCATNPQGQPSVSYDRIADRWVISEAAFALDSNGNPVAPYVQCVAVSTSPDATGTWSRYVFQVSNSLFPDRPALGVWGDGYYLSFNQHTASGAWAGAGALALERSKMLTGAAAQARYFDLEGVTPGLGGMLPATVSGANAPVGGAKELYLQAHDDPANINDRLEVWTFHVDWTAPVTGSTFEPLVNLPLNGGGFGISTTFSCGTPAVSACLQQKSSAQMLDPLAQAHADSTDALPQLGGRLEWGRSAGGDETLTATATLQLGGNLARPGVFELSNTGGAGWGIGSWWGYNPADTINRFLPSAALDNSGEVGLAYVKADQNTFPTTAYTNASDASFGETDLDVGTAPFAGGATYGRYTSLSLDPVDLCTFWFSGPYPDPAGDFAFDSFSFPTCVASTTEPPLLTADPSWTAPLVREGLTITGQSGAFTSAASTTDQWRRCDTRGLNCVDLPGETAATHVMTDTDASGDHTLRFEQIGVNANGTSRAVSTATTLVQSRPPTVSTLPVISGTAQSGQALSTTAGTWTSSSPTTYTYRWRRCTGGVCANIGGANSATYTLVDADVGSTVDVVVSATNTGGGTDANAQATATVTAAAAAPPSGGTSGGGTSGGGTSGGGTSGGSGGGGSAGAPDLAVTGTASSGSPTVGDTVTFALAVTDKNLKAASSLLLTIGLSSGLQYVSSSTDRGNGCVVQSAAQLKCSLDWLSGDAPRANIVFVAKVSAAGAQTLTATALADQGELNPADNTFSVTLNAPPASTGSTAGIPSGLNGNASSPTPAKTKVADHKKPTARALSSKGTRGHLAALRFHIYDDHGFAKAVTTVKRKGKTVTTRRTGFGPVAFGSTYYVGWKIPKKAAKGSYTFCVVAQDRAGNKSRPSCGTLTVK